MTLRRPSAVDALVATVAVVIGVPGALSGDPAGPRAVLWASLACYVVAPLLRRTSLWAAVLVAFTTVVVSFALGLSQQDYLASIIVCLVTVYWVGFTFARGESVLGLGYAFGSVLITNDPSHLGNDLWLVIVIGGAWLAGRALRSRRLLIDDLRTTTAELERSREELAATAVAEERLRIARDIHDVVAHSVTVMLVQAAAAERVMPAHPDAQQAIAAVQETGRQAMGELRELLGVLRVDGSRTGVAPQPGLRDLDALLAHYRTAGLAVDCRSEAPPLPANVELTAYRVAQEALTNVLRHSSARRASVAVTAEPDALVVEVADDGPSRPVHGTPGHGLEGMRERVRACGGELLAGPDGTGFRVRARLPLAVGTSPG